MMPSGMVTPLRVLINDLDASPTYSDARLSQALCVASQQIQVHLSFSTTYTIDYTALTITPDPTVAATRDEDFVVLAVLKAACFMDQSLMRTKAAAAGLRATLGSLSLDTSNNLDGFIKMLQLGPCANFDDMAKDYAFGNPNIMKAVLSPFVNNQFDPRDLNYYMGSDRDRS